MPRKRHSAARSMARRHVVRGVKVCVGDVCASGSSTMRNALTVIWVAGTVAVIKRMLD